MNTEELIDAVETQVRDAGGAVTHFVKVPRELKDLRDGINFALFSLAIGAAEPVERATDDLISVEFRLTPRTQGYLDDLLAQPEFQDNKRKVFHSALYWLQQQPPYIRAVKV